MSGAGAYFPLVVDSLEQGLIARVEVVDGDARPSLTDPAALNAIDDALRDAWRALGGEGPPPGCAVRLTQLDALGALGLRLEGPSLYLSTLLAAAAHFARLSLSRNVLATGHFGVPLGDTTRKLSLSASRRLLLRHEQMLMAGDDGFARGGEQRVATPVEAITHALGYLPWLPGASVTRVFVSVPNPPRAGSPRPRDPPPCWKDRSFTTISLDGPIRGEADYTTLLDRLTLCLGDAPRVELVLAMPQMAAAFLGASLKNERWQIALVDQISGAPIWRKGSRLPPPTHDLTPLPTETSRLILSCRHAPPGWTVLPLGDRIEPVQYPQRLADALFFCQHLGAIEFSTDATVGFAWALGELFSTRRSWSWMQFDQSTGRYLRAF